MKREKQLLFQRDSPKKRLFLIFQRHCIIDPMRKIMTYFVDDWLELTVDILDRYLTLPYVV